MDVAYYLSELLGQHGEINVPGLGYFVQLRVDGYYNNDEATFYPPHHKVGFDPQYIQDEVLTQYLALKKNISLASSKYFTEKYISNLKQEALLQDVAIADLGWLHIEESNLIFKPVEIQANDPFFYGYPRIKTDKPANNFNGESLEVPPTPEPAMAPEHGPEAATGPILLPETIIPEAAMPDPVLYEDNISATREEEPALPAHIADEPLLLPEPVEEAPIPLTEHTAVTGLAYQDFVEEPARLVSETAAPLVPPAHEEEFIFRGREYVEAKPINWVRILLITLIVLLAAAAVLVGLYLYKPSAFDKVLGVKPKPVTLKAVPGVDTAKTVTPVTAPDTAKDTTNKVTPVVKDTTAKVPNALAPANGPASGSIDTAAEVHYEIMGSAFNSLEEANKAIENYKSININAHVLTGPGTGPLKHVSLGTYFSRKEAIDEREKLIASRKVKSDIYVKKINPTK
jgi:cell division septation protein DedD